MYKISDFLSGQVAISVDGSVITAACLGRGVMPDDEFSDVTEKDRQLVLEYMLMISN